MHAGKRVIGLRLEPGHRAVSRAIVDYERLDMRIGLGLDRVETDRNPLQSIEGGNDDCYQWKVHNLANNRVNPVNLQTGIKAKGPWPRSPAHLSKDDNVAPVIRGARARRVRSGPLALQLVSQGA